MSLEAELTGVLRGVWTASSAALRGGGRLSSCWLQAVILSNNGADTKGGGSDSDESACGHVLTLEPDSAPVLDGALRARIMSTMQGNWEVSFADFFCG